MAEGGAAGVADRARNERLTRVVENERLSRMQGLLRAEGITMSKRELAMAQNGDLAMNVTPDQAGQLLRAGLINESQFGALTKGGSCTVQLCRKTTCWSRAAQGSSSRRAMTRARGSKRASRPGPTRSSISWAAARRATRCSKNWLRGGFEMDRKGDWRLKPQVADTLQRDVQAIMVQTGWQRTLARSAEKQTTMGTSWGAGLSAGVTASDPEAGTPAQGGKRTPSGSRGSRGQVGSAGWL